MNRLITAETIEQIFRELGEHGILTAKIRWPEQSLPDHDLYLPFVRSWATFAPWAKDPFIVAMINRMKQRGVISLVDVDRAWTLLSAFRQTESLPGEVWETGVYQGGSATLLKYLIEDTHTRRAQAAPTQLRLFDSFEGLPETSHPLDLHKGGEFGDTGLDQVIETVGKEDWIDFRKGWIPATFAGLEDTRIRFAHVDVDLFQPILDCCAFIYPRLVPGGIMVFDDYGLASCPGARAAVDEFFRNRPECPLALINGQCMVVRHCH